MGRRGDSARQAVGLVQRCGSVPFVLISLRRREALLKAFGINLRLTRPTAGMTQREFVARAKIANLSFVSQLEMGTRSPNLVQLAMLTYAVDVSHDTLLANLPTPRRARSARILIALARRQPSIDADDPRSTPPRQSKLRTHARPTAQP
jgi:transcriptional regulator with XRE-family HTH domain